MQNKKIAFLGCGNMATAILTSLLKHGATEPKNITVCNRTEAKNVLLAEKFGVASTTDAQSLTDADIVFLGIKPQGIKDVDLTMNPGCIVVSMLAGTTIASIKAQIKKSRVIRIMPNIGQYADSGVTGVYFEPDVFTDDEKYALTNLLSNGTTLVHVPDENGLNTIIPVSGSSPGFLMALCESMQQAAEAMGFDTQQSETLIRQTFIGTAQYLSEHPEVSFAQAREMVTSKGGTTAAGLKVFEHEDIAGSIGKVFQAAYDRARELSE